MTGSSRHTWNEGQGKGEGVGVGGRRVISRCDWRGQSDGAVVLRQSHFVTACISDALIRLLKLQGVGPLNHLSRMAKKRPNYLSVLYL